MYSVLVHYDLASTFTNRVSLFGVKTKNLFTVVANMMQLMQDFNNVKNNCIIIMKCIF